MGFLVCAKCIDVHFASVCGWYMRSKKHNKQKGAQFVSCRACVKKDLGYEIEVVTNVQEYLCEDHWREYNINKGWVAARLFDADEYRSVVCGWPMAVGDTHDKADQADKADNASSSDQVEMLPSLL